AAARRAYERGGTRAADGPIEAFFEVAARCNLHCQMCAINYDSRYQPRSGRPPFFEPDLFARLRPIFPSLVRAYLFGLGEPTLNKHLVDYIAELSAPARKCGSTRTRRSSTRRKPSRSRVPAPTRSPSPSTARAPRRTRRS